MVTSLVCVMILAVTVQSEEADVTSLHSWLELNDLVELEDTITGFFDKSYRSPLGGERSYLALFNHGGDLKDSVLKGADITPAAHKKLLTALGAEYSELGIQQKSQKALKYINKSYKFQREGNLKRAIRSKYCLLKPLKRNNLLCRHAIGFESTAGQLRSIGRSVLPAWCQPTI
jgi:hypothetical protein